MTTVQQNNKLCICIEDTSPEERRQNLLKALMAAMRWHAISLYETRRATDSEHVITLSDFMNELTDTNDA